MTASLFNALRTAPPGTRSKSAAAREPDRSRAGDGVRTPCRSVWWCHYREHLRPCPSEHFDRRGEIDVFDVMKDQHGGAKPACLLDQLDAAQRAVAGLVIFLRMVRHGADIGFFRSG